MQEKLEIYKEILAKFNKVHNLTNFTDIKSQIEDSVAVAELLPHVERAADIGSGAGFPAVFLALKRPEISWALFEPNYKKAAFLSVVKQELNLKNVQIYPKKIEETPRFYTGLITSRALMSAERLVQICAGFYDEKTTFLLYKGSGGEEEIRSLKCEKKVVNGEKYRKYIFLTGVKNG